MIVVISEKEWSALHAAVSIAERSVSNEGLAMGNEAVSNDANKDAVGAAKAWIERNIPTA